MEVNSCCIKNKHYCTWIENECSFIEDMERNLLLPLHSFQLASFEDSFVELTHCPIRTTFSSKLGMILELADSKNSDTTL